MEPLKYLPFETFVHTAFWHKLATKKLEDYRLCQGPFDIASEYSNSLAEGLRPRVSVDVSAFSESDLKKFRHGSYRLSGQLTVFNSLDEFGSCDKQSLINQFGKSCFTEALKNNEFLRSPELLLVFQLLTYCDLKHHKFYFWFSYPSVLHNIQPRILSSRLLDEEFSDDQLSQLVRSYEIWRKDHFSAFFVIRRGGATGDQNIIRINSCADMDVDDHNVYLGFCDPSTHEFPGWPLRNMLFALAAGLVHGKKRIRVVCFREKFREGVRLCSHSLVLSIELTEIDPSSLESFVGWEKFENSLKPRLVDLSSTMDPVKLSESAVDLNLKLIKWRLMPDLDLGCIRSTKCLLLGTGTLGCNVSRQLIAWGVRTITLVDNSTVSLSNPVRQTLFTFEDANNREPKSVAAARALSRIFPGVCSKGIQLNIPMPGHPVLGSNFPQVTAVLEKLNSSEFCGDLSNVSHRLSEVHSNYVQLRELITSHDIIFLLTDTRESRWLPTLLANSSGKPVINVALGFDTYLVMRHGIPKERIPSTVETHKTASKFGDACIDGADLGCYFCTDVVGPTNSTINRALDQQCTVTRPGVSMMAASLAVELLITVLQHPEKYRAHARLTQNTEMDSGYDGFSGAVPHQIRGFLSCYKNMLPSTTAFENCPACSDLVLKAFARDGFSFLLRVFEDASYLEQTCGLKKFHDLVAEGTVIALSDDDCEESST